MSPAHTEASTQTAPVDEPPVTDFVTVPHVAPVAVFEYVSPAPVIECVAPAVGSLPPYEVFSAPVCNQVHQELFAVSEMTENIAEIPVVQEQVIVRTRPERLVDARGPQGRLERAACPRSEAPFLSPVVMVQEAAHDDSTVAFLLTQSLRQRQEEVEDAATGKGGCGGGRPAGGVLL